MELVKIQNTENMHPFFNLKEQSEGGPLFFVEETATHYLVAIDIPELPAENIKIRQKSRDLFVEGRPSSDFFAKQIYLQFHSSSNASKTFYQDGLLWLVMPKYEIPQRPSIPKDAV